MFFRGGADLPQRQGPTVGSPDDPSETPARLSEGSSARSPWVIDVLKAVEVFRSALQSQHFHATNQAKTKILSAVFRQKWGIISDDFRTESMSVRQGIRELIQAVSKELDTLMADTEFTIAEVDAAIAKIDNSTTLTKTAFLQKGRKKRGAPPKVALASAEFDRHIAEGRSPEEAYEKVREDGLTKAEFENFLRMRRKHRN
jgi:hypothetical protein